MIFAIGYDAINHLKDAGTEGLKSEFSVKYRNTASDTLVGQAITEPTSWVRLRPNYVSSTYSFLKIFRLYRNNSGKQVNKQHSFLITHSIWLDDRDKKDNTVIDTTESVCLYPGENNNTNHHINIMLSMKEHNPLSK